MVLALALRVGVCEYHLPYAAGVFTALAVRRVTAG